MKQELLEYIIRSCVKEVLTQVNEEEETKGAPAPPADGLGTADQPPVPKNDSEPDEEPEEKPEQEAPPPTNLKGVILVNPRDKSALRPIPLRAGNDAGVERALHQVAAAIAGSNVKVAISTLRMVRDALRNPNSSVYVYLGKYDPQSDEVFLMADKSLQVAKDASIEATDIQNGSTFASKSAAEHPDDVANQMLNKGFVHPAEPIDENLKATIKKMVNQLLDGK